MSIAWYFHGRQNAASTAHAPVSVLVADFQNNTSDSLFDDTLEPMVNVALEGASSTPTTEARRAGLLGSFPARPTNSMQVRPDWWPSTKASLSS
jgi:hypothetical protein